MTRKKTKIITAFSLLFFGVKAYAGNINSQINAWTALNRACRDGRGDSPATKEACQKRSTTEDLLKQSGLCMGKYNLERFSDWNADTIVREKWIPCYYKGLTE